MRMTSVIDWHSRYVLAWQLSNSLDGIFCLDALRQAPSKGRAKIFNTDQGVQFTADAFTACLLIVQDAGPSGGMTDGNRLPQVSDRTIPMLL